MAEVTPNLDIDLDAIIGAGPIARNAIIGAGPIARNAIKAAFRKVDDALVVVVPTFDPVDDEGKVLKVVSGELAWATDETTV